jgi:hypothetical protein
MFTSWDTKVTHEKDECMNWLLAKDELKEKIETGALQPDSPSTLLLHEIELMDAVFQHRTNSEWASEGHVKNLLKGLKNTSGKPFEPVTVMWGGNSWVLVDGHHRVKAYQEYGFNAPIPVQVFQGTLEEAFGEALRANVQDKLSMSSKEKTNAAWRLVIGTELSISATAQLSLTSKATVKHMRKVRDALSAKYHHGFLGQLDWPAARARFDGIENEFDNDGAWLDKKARMIADKLTKTFGNELSKYPKALWKALDIYDDNLAYAFCNEHGIDSSFLEPPPNDYDEVPDF